MNERGPNPLDSTVRYTEKKPESPRKPRPGANMSGISLGLGILFAFLAVVLVVILGFTYFLPDAPTTQVDYGPYHFALDTKGQTRGSWRFDWQTGSKVYSVPLRYNPYDVENVTIQGSLNESFDRDLIYIAFDPTTANYTTLTLANGELSLNLVRAARGYGIPVTNVSAACTVNETDACADRPILSCGAPNKSVVLMRDEGEAKIWLRDDCIILFGNGLELLRSVDRLLYELYGVMQRDV